ncbi:RagB/SusD family nutrient uptake outer membrane protein [Terrimonas sp. NA20]|uniref:RagB/SusD family nutrient uptake outer membrane protein n=1 Tax=Terrimonas ginsenosidimutans TaxID=2908004 RepID=A0ABS9KPS4_9BACT|nr:RagB/SusD family nutrient uptake outer membrane protein [Terrimonas ginsenosidimutans]MCG2614330.1 RagB/SusD family nutrient uptake outer membrane protein [Terrimonas ginsenosidimutans]
MLDFPTQDLDDKELLQESNDVLHDHGSLAVISDAAEKKNDLPGDNRFFILITDPTILEVRRERGIGLSLEGFRFADILRWKRVELMTQEWNGFYVPSLNTPMDLNEDGILDVAFFRGTRPSPTVAGVTHVDVSARIGNAVNSQLLRKALPVN